LQELHEIAQDVDVVLRALLSEREVEVLGKTLMRIHEHFGHHKEERDAHQC
jgi:hypothetical protein